MILMKKHYKPSICIILLVISIIVIAGLPGTFAADININASTEGGIATAINNVAGSNDRIILAPGNYTGINNTGINISKNVTIIGNGPTEDIVIDAGKISRIFTLTNNINVTFINITFKNGYSSAGGGAIHNQFSNTTMTIINCTFIDNNATTSGGAIYNGMGSNCIVVNSTFKNNVARSATGGGGGIYNSGPNFTVINSSFINNTVSGYGAAIHNSGSYSVNFTIINSTFIDNTANSVGGAIYNTLGSNFRVFDSTFTNNKELSSNGGGAIYNVNGNFSVANSFFTNNSEEGSVGGGAIYTHNGNFTVNNSTFIANNAKNGGGIFSTSNSNVTVVNSIFINNTATNSGGAIYNNANMLLTGNIMIGNSADFSGNDIYNNRTIGFLNLTFLNNSTIQVRNNTLVTLYATLTDDMGNPITGGNINFYLDNNLLATVTSLEGKANITFTPTDLGLILINGNYSGNGSDPVNVKSGQLYVVLKLDTNSTITVTGILKVNHTVIISGILTDWNGELLGGIVLNITVDGVNVTVTTDPDGNWNYTYIPLATGNVVFDVSWAGNNDYYGFNNSIIFNINKSLANSTIIISGSLEFNQTVIISGVLTDEFYNLLASVVLNISINGVNHTVTTDTDGKWTYSHTLSGTGNVIFSVTWIGNNSLFGFKNYTTFNVKKSQIILEIDLITNLDGSVTILANVRNEEGNPLNGHNVVFILNGKIIGYGITGDWGDGCAVLTVPNNKLSIGKHNITVIVKGGDNFNDEFLSLKFTKTDDSNNTNTTNKTTKNPTTVANMKKTGIPIIFILLCLLTIICQGVNRKRFD